MHKSNCCYTHEEGELSKCSICNNKLEEYEQGELNCGHYACNSCSYSRKIRTGLNVTECANCFETPSLEEE